MTKTYVCRTCSPDDPCMLLVPDHSDPPEWCPYDQGVFVPAWSRARLEDKI